MTARNMPTKAERALELFEKGIGTDAIAVRLGTTVQSVGSLLSKARAKREREAEVERAGRLSDIMGHNV